MCSLLSDSAVGSVFIVMCHGYVVTVDHLWRYLIQAQRRDFGIQHYFGLKWQYMCYGHPAHRRSEKLQFICWRGRVHLCPPLAMHLIEVFFLNCLKKIVMFSCLCRHLLCWQYSWYAADNTSAEELKKPVLLQITNKEYCLAKKVYSFFSFTWYMMTQQRYLNVWKQNIATCVCVPSLLLHMNDGMNFLHV